MKKPEGSLVRQLCPWMKLFMDLVQQGAIYVGINFGGIDGGVSQHLLHGAQVSTAFQQVCSKRMPEDMRINIFFDAGAFGRIGYDIPDAHARQRVAALAQKDFILSLLRIFIALEFGSYRLNIVL